MIYILPYIITYALRLPFLHHSRRHFNGNKKGLSFAVAMNRFSIKRTLYRNLSFSVIRSNHEDLLKVLDTYKKSLKDDMCAKSDKEKSFSLSRLNGYSVCQSEINGKNKISYPPNESLNMNSEFKSHGTSANENNIEFINSKSEKQQPFVASYDPSSLGENLYHTALDFNINEQPNVSEETVVDAQEEKITEPKKSIKKNLKSKDLEKTEKNNYLTRSLSSYIQVCGSADMVHHAHESVLYYRFKSKLTKKNLGSIDIAVYNAILQCWSELGNLQRMKEIFSYMGEDNIEPNLQSYYAYFECIFRTEDMSSKNVQSAINYISNVMEKHGKDLSYLFKEHKFSSTQLKKIANVLQPSIHKIPCTEPYNCHVPYKCVLLENLNDKSFEQNTVAPFLRSHILKNNIHHLTSEQMKLEELYFLKVRSVNSKAEVSSRVQQLRKYVQEYEDTFKSDLLHALEVKLANMWNDVKGQKCMTLYPYLKVINKETFIMLLLQEVRMLAETAEFFSPNVKIMCSSMGTKVMNYYFIWMRQKNKTIDKISLIHSDYIKYLMSPQLVANYTPREYWEFLKRLHFNGPVIDVPDVSWPHHVLYEVGKFLYDTLLETASFDVNKLRPKAKSKLIVRPFYTTYERCRRLKDEPAKGKSSLQMRAHPKICKLYREAELEHIEFDVSMIPMFCPPRPWTKLEAGGLLMTSVPLIRLPPYAHQHNAYYKKVPNVNFLPCFDSLNSLSLCPWIINKPVLDEIIKVFKDGGCEELDVPLNPDNFNDKIKIKSTMSYEEKKKIRREKAILRKKRLETTSLWFDCLYKLSIANYFRDTIFWFPHNLDFRGRVYPTPPHFNHLGSDMVRSILLFAEGKPLGKNGLNWLKIHLVNLTGFKKREPNSERLKYANEIMDEILDSADNPFTGRQWWKTSDEPWQTLACCKEIASAIRSLNPEHYISHFPVHQDGSCNGLQHYAALGRDKLGAKEVNLYPSDCPQDVYTGVANLVELERVKNAKEGSELAIALEGFVKRKVVKQTVMTFVYGVTEYGAKEQILKQLKNTDFPAELANAAARYLMKHTFASIQKMFTATRAIQKWFTDSAELITKITGEPVEWITPLGLPVIQPYHRKVTVRSMTDFIATGRTGFFASHNPSASAYESTMETYQLPNVRKQKNAFAPNFIHSLDSSHMMLTSLYCQRKGITFVSVHDCYWTHPCTVEIMNKVCREQFVALHNQPILESLSAFFMENFTDKINIDNSSNNEEIKLKQVEKLKSVLSKVPKKGTFELENVLDSIYFFS